MATKSRKSAAKKTLRSVSRTVRKDFGLNMNTFSKMTGIPAAVLSSWEKGETELDTEPQRQVKQVAQILKKLSQVMRKSFIPIWLTKSSTACVELKVRDPLELFERGNLQALEHMVYYLESGSPS